MKYQIGLSLFYFLFLPLLGLAIPLAVDANSNILEEQGPGTSARVKSTSYEIQVGQAVVDPDQVYKFNKNVKLRMDRSLQEELNDVLHEIQAKSFGEIGLDAMDSAWLREYDSSGEDPQYADDGPPATEDDVMGGDPLYDETGAEQSDREEYIDYYYGQPSGAQETGIEKTVKNRERTSIPCQLSNKQLKSEIDWKNNFYYLVQKRVDELKFATLPKIQIIHYSFPRIQNCRVHVKLFLKANASAQRTGGAENTVTLTNKSLIWTVNMSDAESNELEDKNSGENIFDVLEKVGQLISPINANNIALANKASTK